MLAVKGCSVKIGVVFSLIVFFVTGCGSHYYYDEAVSYIPEIKEILVASQKCKADSDCSLAFSTGEAFVIAGKPFGGVSISIYEVSEVGIISKLLEASIRNHQNHPEIETTVKIYSSAHRSDKEVLVADLKLSER